VGARIGNVAVIALIFALFWAPLGHDQPSVLNRAGMIQHFTANVFMGMMNCVAAFSIEREVFYREDTDEVYTAVPFFFSYFSHEIAFEVVSAFLFTLFAGTSFIMGFQGGAHQFFYFFAVVLCYANAGESIGMIFLSLFTASGFSLTGTNMLLSFFTMMTGLVSLNVPPFIDYISYISIMRWGTRVLFLSEFHDLPITCDFDPLHGHLKPCIVNNGEQAIQMFRQNDVSLETALGITFFLAIIYRVIAFVLFYLERRRSKARFLAQK